MKLEQIKENLKRETEELQQQGYTLRFGYLDVHDRVVNITIAFNDYSGMPCAIETVYYKIGKNWFGSKAELEAAKEKRIERFLQRKISVVQEIKNGEDTVLRILKRKKGYENLEKKDIGDVMIIRQSNRKDYLTFVNRKKICLKSVSG